MPTPTPERPSTARGYPPVSQQGDRSVDNTIAGKRGEHAIMALRDWPTYSGDGRLFW